MKISLTGLVTVLSTAGFALAQYNYYDTSGSNNNKNNNSDKDDNFSKKTVI